MNKIFNIIQIFLLVTATLAVFLHMTRSETSEDRGFYIRSTATFANEGNEIWNLTQEDRSWPLFMNNSGQTVRVVYHSNPLETITQDVDNNTLAVFRFQSTLQAKERVTDCIVYHVRSKPRSVPNMSYAESGTFDEIPSSLQARYCGGYGFWMTDETQIRERALTIAGNETRVLAVVSKLVSWMWNNIKYKSHDPTLYPDETLSLGEGDCDEQAILLGTFCRVLRIPSYLQIGCIFNPETNSSDEYGRVHYALNDIAWHGWAIIYVPPWGWLPVDLTYVTGSHSEPLNAIRTGAVTFQCTVQGMNINENDYLASDRAYKELLGFNNFSLYLTDEMSETSPLLGDLNGDDVIDILDLLILAKAFGSKPNDANWNTAADVNRDETVNIFDLSIAARQFGKRE